MKQRTAVFLSLTLFGVTMAHAQLVVEDPISIAQDATNQVINLAKYVEMIDNQVQQINSLTQQVQQLGNYITLFGNPSKVAQLIGVDALTRIIQQPSVALTLGQLQSLASGVNALANNSAGLYQTISTLTDGGITLQRNTNSYRGFDAASQATGNYTNVYNDVATRRTALQNDMASTLDQLKSASTDAETQKLQGKITALQGELQSVDGQLANAFQEVAVQDIANRNDQAKQDQAREEELAADRDDAFAKMGAFFSVDDKPINFGGSQ